MTGAIANIAPAASRAHCVCSTEMKLNIATVTGRTLLPPSTTASSAPAIASVAPEVTITSSAPDSVVGDYRIDMARMDTDGDGRLSRAEASANATLAAEFAAVDANGDGVLDAQELKGWQR